MNIEKLKGLTVLGCLLSVAGFIVLFSSVNFGTSLAHKWQFKRGAVAEPSMYATVIESYTNMFLITGSIFLGIGLLTLILTYYTLLTLKE